MSRESYTLLSTEENDDSSIRESTIAEQANEKVIRKVFSNGISSVLTSVNSTANSLIFIRLGDGGAGSLTTAYQALFRNVCSGVLMSGGVALGDAIGEGDDSKVNRIVDASYALTFILTVTSSVAYGATYFIFPKLFSHDTAVNASNYFLWAVLGNWPSLALVTVGQIAYQCGSWKSSMVSNVVYRIPAAILSYLFAYAPLHMKADGIGLGNLIAPWIAYLGMEWWWRKKDFRTLELRRFSLQTAKTELKPLSWLGLKMATQRITEWGNLMVITLILGQQKDNLTVVNPSIQLMAFLNLFSQGIGLGGNMLLNTNKSRLKKLNVSLDARNDKEITEMKTIQSHIEKISKQCLYMGALINGSCAIILFFSKKPIVNFFLSNNESSDMRAIAGTTLWVNGIGLLMDAIRIISSNLLNAYGDIARPNMISLFFMTILGIPLAYGLDKAKMGNAIILMFAIRTAMITVSAAINLYSLYKHILKDRKIIEMISFIVHRDCASIDSIENAETASDVSLPMMGQR